MNEWIPVTEDLPKDAKTVFITYGCGEMRFVAMGNFTEFPRKGRKSVKYARFRDPDEGTWYNVTMGKQVIRPFEVYAWMPAPEPYRG